MFCANSRECTETLFAWQENTYAQRLPKGWDVEMPLPDQNWIGGYVFAKKGVLADPTVHWYHPPERWTKTNPAPGEYFLRRLFIWAPRMAYRYDFKCVSSNGSLHSKGLFNSVRIVLDTSC